MARFGSNPSAFQSIAVPTVDPSGNLVIDSTNGIGSSPLGIAAREQIFFGVPNGSFSNLPPDPFLPIDDETNPLPYWSVTNSSTMTVTSELNTTTQTWGVTLNPGTAAAGDYIQMKTRVFVATDDYLQIRQRAYLNLIKNGTYAGTTQYNITVSGTYFDATGASVGTATFGTALDNGTAFVASNYTGRVRPTTTPGGSTITGVIGGPTTGGDAAIPTNSIYAEFVITLTATAAVTSSTSFTLQSFLVDSTPLASGQVIATQVFTSSGTFTVPTGVTNVSIFAVGGGGGGASGSAAHGTAVLDLGAPGGGGAGIAIYAQDVPVTSGSAYAVGIGTAGVGGTARVLTRTAGNATSSLAGVNGGAGGATTFGSLVSAGGGGGGLAAQTGGVAGTTATLFFDSVPLTAATGGAGGAAGNAGSSGSSIGAVQFTSWPFVSSVPTAGAAGGTVTFSSTTGGTSLAGTAGTGGAAGFAGSGGGAGAAKGAQAANVVYAAGNGGFGGGGGAGASGIRNLSTGSGTISVTAGSGGAARPNSGGGGGAGGVAIFEGGLAGYPAGTTTSGAGGDGATGYLVVSWVA